MVVGVIVASEGEVDFRMSLRFFLMNGSEIAGRATWERSQVCCDQVIFRGKGIKAGWSARTVVVKRSMIIVRWRKYLNTLVLIIIIIAKRMSWLLLLRSNL